MKIIRVFPRKTNATPDDELVRFEAPTLFDEADEIHISVAFDWDKLKAEQLEKDWRVVGKTTIGGPAYNDRGEDFIPGRYLKNGHLITSRGCPNKCWFCRAWRNEGNIRELEVKDGWIIHDNNLLATSKKHQIEVFEMLLRQKEKARFTGGLEAKLFSKWHLEWLLKIKPSSVWFAYDEDADYEPLKNALSLFKNTWFENKHIIQCFVLIGYENDTIENAENRLKQVIELGAMPQAMLFNRKEDIKWRRFQREWANKIIVGSKMKNIRNI